MAGREVRSSSAVSSTVIKSGSRVSSGKLLGNGCTYGLKVRTLGFRAVPKGTSLYGWTHSVPPKSGCDPLTGSRLGQVPGEEGDRRRFCSNGPPRLRTQQSLGPEH